ncbi:ricin-type beta-trefoil lectin domain protein [Streptomyces sp. NPDC000594]|uniref:ricin-type beta-trefoil lectin domain protein n=1 Tax=Streptomyces sp. NPDC000594 TaxID=3154261 RepID=UPI003316C4AF
MARDRARGTARDTTRDRARDTAPRRPAHRLARRLRSGSAWSRTLLTAAATLLTAAVTALVPAPTAAASDTPGTYTNYRFPAGTAGFSDITFRTTVTQDPGRTANVFWSHQFAFTGGYTAYTGMQANGPGQERTFLFSVWDAKEARAGSTGSYCVDFGGEGEGKSCRLRRDWQQGHTYRTTVAHEGENWFGVTVTDETTRESFTLGSIRAAAATVSPQGMVDWTEYFEWNDPRASCYDQPYSRAEFGLPQGDGESVAAAVSTTSTSTSCAKMSAVTTTATGSAQTNAIGNSLRGTIGGPGGKVVDASGGSVHGTPAILYRATGGSNQSWVLGADGAAHLMKSGLCLEATGGATQAGTAVRVATCDGGPGQQWRAAKGALTNPASGRCLAPRGGATTDSTRLELADCDGSAAQRWTVPATPRP